MTVTVWNLNTGAFLNVYEGHENNVPMVQVSLADNIMVSCSRDQTVKIWVRRYHVASHVQHQSAVGC